MCDNSVSIWWHSHLPPAEKIATGGYLYRNVGSVTHTHTLLFTSPAHLVAYIQPHVKTFLCKIPGVLLLSTAGQEKRKIIIFIFVACSGRYNPWLLAVFWTLLCRNALHKKHSLMSDREGSQIENNKLIHNILCTHMQFEFSWVELVH